MDFYENDECSSRMMACEKRIAEENLFPNHTSAFFVPTQIDKIFVDISK